MRLLGCLSWCATADYKVDIEGEGGGAGHADLAPVCARISLEREGAEADQHLQGACARAG